jgi:hypothetical protein
MLRRKEKREVMAAGQLARLRNVSHTTVAKPKRATKKTSVKKITKKTSPKK